MKNNRLPIRTTQVLLLSLTLLISSLSLADTNSNSLAGIDDLSCAISDSQFEVPTIISTSSKQFSGQCIDSKRFRPAVITSKNKTTLTFENYLHENKYWTAKLSQTAEVESVYVQIIKFNIISGVTAAHVQLRAKFSAGSEIKLSSGSEEILVNDIVVSFEAARPKGVSYNFALGVVDNYLLVGRIASGAQRLSEYSKENQTEQYLLDLDKNDRLELLMSALQLSNDSKMKRFYNTLKPNCTTEIFDLIDRLPSQELKGSEPFLTMISNDPVAGPTLDGLQERNLLTKRVANLRDELENGATQAPKEIASKNKLNLLVQIPDNPYSIVLVIPEGVQGEKALVDAKKLAYNMAPQLIQRLTASLMLSGVDKSLSLLESLKDLSPLLKSELQKINSQLTNKPIRLALYLTPWDKSLGKKVDPMKEINVPARLPFNTFESNFDFMSINSIHSGLNDAANIHSENNVSFGLMGIVVQLNLVKDKSTITLQAAGQIGAVKKELIVANDQVNIKKFIVPEGSSFLQQPVAILNLSQNMYDDVPSLSISFGNFGGLNSDSSSKGLGLFLINTDDTCAIRGYSVPAMQGTAAKLSLIDVWMDIFSIDFDLNNLTVKTMDVRVTSGVGGLKTGVVKSCESDPKVNKEFSDSVNAQINSQKEKLEQSPGLSLLDQILSNNKSGKASGF